MLEGFEEQTFLLQVVKVLEGSHGLNEIVEALLQGFETKALELPFNSDIESQLVNVTKRGGA